MQTTRVSAKREVSSQEINANQCNGNRLKMNTSEFPDHKFSVSHICFQKCFTNVSKTN